MILKELVTFTVLTHTMVINTCNRIIKKNSKNYVNTKLKILKKSTKKPRKPLTHVYPNNLKKKNHKSKLLDQQGANLLKGKFKSFT